MRADVPPLEVLRHTFRLDPVSGGEDPQMRRMAECVGELRPVIEQLGGSYGDRLLIWALTAIAIHIAVDAEDAEFLATIFRSNARLLELEARVGSSGFAS